MVKRMLLVVSLVLTVFLGGCNLNFTSTVGGYTNTQPITTTTTITYPISTTTTESDMEAVISAVYERIYQEMYDQLRSEMISDLSEEAYAQIYDDVLSDLYAKINEGTLSLEALSYVDQVMNVALNSSKAIIGVSNLNASGVTQSIGSGVIYKRTSNTYYVVTNHHVIEDGSLYEVYFQDGSTLPATLLGSDDLVDIAVLTFISDNDLTVVDFADSDLVKQGQIVLAVGNPNGYDYFNSITMGIVSGLDRFFDIDNDEIKDMFVNYIQHDAAINSGNSGGALFNLDGDVIGINVIKIASAEIEGMGFAIPSELVERIVNDIELYGVSKQVPVLGITFIDIEGNPEYFTTYNITLPSEITNGFYVTAVQATASFGGYVVAGDIVTQVGDVVIVNSVDFKEYFSQYRVGDVIDVVVYRNGNYVTLQNIELKPKP